MIKLLRTSIRQFSAIQAPKLQFDPYTVDENQYKDITSKIKFRTGYSLMEVEPFPRMKIMKIAKHLLHRLKNEIPENAIFRIYMEEKIKYYMEVTHETTDILELEGKLDVDCIEMFIETFAKETLFIDYILKEKPWDNKFTEEDIEAFKLDRMTRDEALRYEKKLQETPKAVLEEK